MLKIILKIMRKLVNIDTPRLIIRNFRRERGDHGWVYSYKGKYKRLSGNKFSRWRTFRVLADSTTMLRKKLLNKNFNQYDRISEYKSR